MALPHVLTSPRPGSNICPPRQLCTFLIATAIAPVCGSSNFDCFGAKLCAKCPCRCTERMLVCACVRVYLNTRKSAHSKTLRLRSVPGGRAGQQTGIYLNMNRARADKHSSWLARPSARAARSARKRCDRMCAPHVRSD